MDKKVWEWKRTAGPHEFVISTARDLLPHAFVQEAFNNKAMFWAKPMSAADLETMLNNSCTLGLYRVGSNNSLTAVGMARLVTDFVTLAYLTDVYLQDDTRGLGLGEVDDPVLQGRCAGRARAPLHAAPNGIRAGATIVPARVWDGNLRRRARTGRHGCSEDETGRSGSRHETPRQRQRRVRLHAGSTVHTDRSKQRNNVD